jgi:hypothetical protein
MYLRIANTNAVTKHFMLQLRLLHDFCAANLKIRYKLHIGVGPTIHLPHPLPQIKNVGCVSGSPVS